MAQEKPIRFGIVGAGKTGAFYARALAGVPDAVLTAVCDPDLLSAQKLAWEYNATPYSKPEDLPAQINAVILTSPVARHYADGMYFLERGIHALVEKPLAQTMQQAQDLIRAARRNNTALQVGHVERFTPAAVEAAKHIQDPRFITVERMAPYDGRTADLSVVLDLMLSDLDLLLTLVQADVTSIDATGLSVFSPHEDVANVRLRFANGAVADVTASRASFERRRVMHVFQRDGYVSVDFMNARVKTYRKEKPVLKSLKDVTVRYPQVEKQPPLTGELLHFIRSVRTRARGAEGGMKALELALKITEQINRFDVPKTGHVYTPQPFRLVSDAAAAARIALDETIGHIKRED